MSNSSSSKHSKIVLVTGATAGIGRMTALHLAKLGHHVIASGRKLPELAALKAEAGSLQLDTVALDVTSPDSMHSSTTRASASWARRRRSAIPKCAASTRRMCSA